MRVAALLVLLSALAHAEEPPFWGEVAHPERDKQRALVGEAIAMVRAGAYARAVPLLEQSTELVPDDPFPWYLLGVSQRGLRGWAACADSLLRLERLDAAFVPPSGMGTPPATELAGECLANAGRIEEAVVRFERAARGAPAPGPDPEVLSWLGDCYQALGRLEDAIDAYRRALARKPQDPLLLFSLAVALDRDEQLVRARETALAGLRIDPQLLRLRAASVTFIPPSDLFYYLGFGNLVAWGEGQAPERRARAIVAFRRYQRDLSAGLWRGRVLDHMARLGPAQLGVDEVQLDPVTGLSQVERERVAGVVLKRGGDLQACLAGYPAVAVRARVLLIGPPKPDPAKKSPPKPPALPAQPSTWVESLGLDALPDGARPCVEKIMKSLRFPPIPAGVRTQVTVSVIAA